MKLRVSKRIYNLILSSPPKNNNVNTIDYAFISVSREFVRQVISHNENNRQIFRKCKQTSSIVVMTVSKKYVSVFTSTINYFDTFMTINRTIHRLF